MSLDQLLILIEKCDTETAKNILKVIAEENCVVREQLKEMFTDYLLNQLEK